jgi:two-component system alkaline phosphatase synthesis response regulator PhoP
LVEDDANLADGLRLNLEAEGFEVLLVDHGNRVMETYQQGAFDLVLMDVMLPGRDGLTLCRELRSRGATLPILFITARDQVDQRIEGLVAGGDDYITKPFSTAELVARIQGIFRRQAWLTDSTLQSGLQFDGRSIDFKTYHAEGPGGKFELSRRECMVMKYLAERSGEVVSRDQLLDAVWGYRVYPSSRTIDNFIMKLRKIFEDDPARPRYIETIRGVGYRFKPGE